MGLEVVCVARWGGEASEGKLQLETDELRFSGSFRLKIPIRSMARVEAHDGILEVVVENGVAEFELGDRAEKWRHKILHPPTLADKLGMRAGTRVRIIGEPQPGFMELIEATGATAIREGSAEAEMLAAFVENRSELETLFSSALPSVPLWIMYPKRRKEITEMDVLSRVRAAGLVDTKVARFSESHTALRFAPAKDRR
jgi:hypothetical protein